VSRIWYALAVFSLVAAQARELPPLTRRPPTPDSSATARALEYVRPRRFFPPHRVHGLAHQHVEPIERDARLRKVTPHPGDERRRQPPRCV